MAPEISLREERPISKVLERVEARPGVPKPAPILIVDGMRRAFGGLLAVDVEHLEIQRSCVTALIGPNGSGKTTLFNLLCAFDDPDEGQWRFFWFPQCLRGNRFAFAAGRGRSCGRGLAQR